MQLDARPKLSQQEEVAVLRAIAAAHVRFDEAPPAYASAWRRAALDEAVGGGQVTLSGTWQPVRESVT